MLLRVKKILLTEVFFYIFSRADNEMDLDKCCLLTCSRMLYLRMIIVWLMKNNLNQNVGI